MALDIDRNSRQDWCEAMIAAHRHTVAANPGKVAALRALFPEFRCAIGHLASMSRRELLSGEQLVHWRVMPNDCVGSRPAVGAAVEVCTEHGVTRTCRAGW